MGQLIATVAETLTLRCCVLLAGMGQKRGHQDRDGSPSPKHELESLQGVTYDSKRKNYKARIHFAGREVYIGRCVLLLGTTLVFLSYPSLTSTMTVGVRGG